MTLTLSAYAKINLHLDVGPRRTDGYHELETLFQEISLCDHLKFDVIPEKIELVTPTHVPQGSDNIIVKTLQALRRKMKVKKGMRVILDKKIPMGAGLGGGSSDAAAALRAGWWLWKNPRLRTLPEMKTVPPVLTALAKKMGADVTFFLQGGAAWAKGIGEKCEWITSSPKQWVVLVNPRINVPTAKAYQWLDSYRKKTKVFVSFVAMGEIPSSAFYNSFEPVVFKKFPEIALAKKTLINLGCKEVRMSGSGSTVFGFIENPVEGARVLNQIPNRNWDTFLATTR